MDILATLLFFLVLGASFTSYSVLFGTSLERADSTQQEEKPTFVLKVTVRNSKSVKIWLGPLKGLKIMDKRKFLSYMRRNSKGNFNAGYTRYMRSNTKEKLTKRLQDFLKRLKVAFPHQTKVVAAFNDRVKYQHMIDYISSLRTVPPDGKAFSLVNFLGHREETKVLFPEVLISEDI